MLAKPPRVENVDWGKVKLFWGDERWVSQDDVQSNFKMVHETLLSQLGTSQPQVFAVDTSLETPMQAAKHYAEVIQKELPNDPRFDLMLLGIGEDGHTASLFPGAQVLRDKNPALCVATEQPEEKKPRISLSPRAILSSRRILFLVKGEAKADMVQRIIEGNESVETLPACLYRDAQDHVYFFLDSAAALKLKR
jgi:6-phosphogluconolactonase